MKQRKFLLFFVLVIAMAFVSTVQAINAPVNPSFETVDDVDEGPNDKVAGFVDMVSISSTGWNVEGLWVGQPFEEIANCAALPGWLAEGDYSSVRTGNNWLRLSGDWGLAGGVNQNLGPMVSGQTYKIGVDVFAYDLPDFGLVDYTPTMELYSGSIDPGNLLDSDTISLDCTSGTGALNTGTMIVETTAVDTSDLILRMYVPDPQAQVALRGGLDNVLMPYHYQRAYNPTPADGAENVGTVSEGGGAIDPVAASWSVPQIATDVVTVIDNPDVTSYNVYKREAASADPNFYLVSSPITTSTSIAGLVPGTEYQWRVDAMLSDANTISGNIWTFTTTQESPIIVTQPVDQLVDAGTAVVFTVVAINPFTGIEDDDLTYSWYRVGEPDVSVGTNSPTLTIPAAKVIDGAEYYCKVIVTKMPDLETTTENASSIIKKVMIDIPFDGNPNDVSANGYIPVVEGEPSYEPGMIGQAVSVDGLDDRFNYGDALLSDSGQMTVALWVQPNMVGEDWAGFLCKWIPDPLTLSLWMGQHYIDGWVRFGIFDPYSNTELPTDSETALLTNGQWTHVVGTYDGHFARLYAEGVLVAVGPDRNVPFVDKGGEFLVGGVWDLQWFGGLIDEVKVYNYALTAQEIAEMYLEAPEKDYVCVDRPQYDFDGDCLVTLNDFVEIAAEWLLCGIYPTCITEIPD